MMNNDITIKNCIRINANDRLYLAMSRRDVCKNMILVYTLACPANGRGGFYLNPITEVATFSSQKSANQYVNTVASIASTQSQYPMHNAICRVLRQERILFRQRTK